jgi:predicted phosphodiesterase
LKKIGLISDTHGYLDEQVIEHFKNCDEIWHAGDFGNIELAEKLAAFKPLQHGSPAFQSTGQWTASLKQTRMDDHSQLGEF